jgi:hypothetical protein
MINWIKNPFYAVESTVETTPRKPRKPRHRKHHPVIYEQVLIDVEASSIKLTDHEMTPLELIMYHYSTRLNT